MCKNKIYSFCFCGGEPLLRYDLVLKMCQKLRHVCKDLNMVSNGFLITEEKIIELKKAGLNLLQISLDGSNAKTHDYMRGINGAFEKAINAIKLADKHNLKTSIAFCPTSFNTYQFPELVSLLSEYKNIVRIRTQPFMNLGRGSLNAILPTEDNYRYLVKYINKYNKINNHPKIEWGDPVEHLIIWGELKNKIYPSTDIKSNGDLTVSPYLPITVGNLKKHSITEYWENGLPYCWRIPLVNSIAKKQTSISYLGNTTQKLPKIFFNKNIEIDLIDDNVFNNLNDFILEE